MNNFHQLLDVKLSIAGLFFLLINIIEIELFLKILGSVLFIGYNIRRWWLMEKRNKNQQNQNNQDDD